MSARSKIVVSVSLAVALVTSLINTPERGMSHTYGILASENLVYCNGGHFVLVSFSNLTRFCGV